MLKKATIGDMIEAVRLRMPTWGFLPFTLLHIDPINVKVLDKDGKPILKDMVLILLRKDYTQAWDVAAFVNTQARPHKNQSKDYPDLKKKPLDAPFGPYADSFTSSQHKFGPFAPIAAFYKKFNK